MQKRTRIKRRLISYRRRHHYGPKLQVIGERQHIGDYEKVRTQLRNWNRDYFGSSKWPF